MPAIKRNEAAMASFAAQKPELVKPIFQPTLSDTIDRLGAIHARLEDQVKSLTHIGNCYLGSSPLGDEPIQARPLPDGSLNVLADQVGDIEELLSALEGKIDRFRGRH